MPMTRRCRYWQSSRPSPVASGPMSATTARLAARIRPRRCSTTLATAPAIIPANISPVTPASCRPMRSLASTVSMMPGGSPRRLSRRRAGATAAGTSLISQHCRSPIAAEAVRRIDELFEIERTINGKMPAERVAVRQEQAKPLVEDLKVCMRQQRDRLAPSHDLAKAINYILSRWVAFTRFLDDGRICLSNNAAERGVRCVALGRRNWTFAGSDAGGHRAAAAYTLMETCKLNDVDPQAWLPGGPPRLAG